MRDDSRVGSRDPGGSAGFALILAILALLLLTFLGLTLAVTTSTELQIATNYRWSQQALYNAEAGVEAGKALLSTMDWASIVWSPRTASWDGMTDPAGRGGGVTAPFERQDEWGHGSRNFESWSCDTKGNGVGFGVVLDDGTSAEAPYQYKTTVFGQQLHGAFTLWVRRPVEYKTDGTLQDWDDNNDNLILVSEGVAPFSGASITTSLAAANKAVQLIEVALTRADTTASGGCGSRGGQAGGGPLGAGFDACSNLTGGAAVTGALAGAAPGSGRELNPNQ